MKAQKVAMLLALGAAMAVGPPSEAAAERITIDCANEIDAPGSYILRNSVSGCTSTRIIEISASDVTLDLNGNVLDGDPAACLRAIHVTGTRTNVKIKNGTVGDCENGILFDPGITRSVITKIHVVGNEADGISVNDQNRIVGNVVARNGSRGINADDETVVENNTVSGNDSDGIIAHDGSVVRNNITQGNGNFGIAATGELITIAANNVVGNSHGIFFTKAVIRGNKVEGNLGAGLQQLSPGEALLENNTVRGNGFGVMLSSDATVVANRINGNSSQGIQGVGTNTIRENTINGNGGHGAFLTDTGNKLIRNQANRNAGSGIHVTDGTPSTTIKGNTANDNGELGIDAEPGVLGTGTNHASGNLGGPPQCDPSDLCV